MANLLSVGGLGYDLKKKNGEQLGTPLISQLRTTSTSPVQSVAQNSVSKVSSPLNSATTTTTRTRGFSTQNNNLMQSNDFTRQAELARQHAEEQRRREEEERKRQQEERRKQEQEMQAREKQAREQKQQAMLNSARGNGNFLHQQSPLNQNTFATQSRQKLRSQPINNDQTQERPWQKYQEEERQKIREEAFKKDWGGATLQDIFSSGWDKRQAEVNARNRYTKELNDKAFDSNGNIVDQDAFTKAKNSSLEGMGVANQYANQDWVNGRAIGATYDSDYKNNPLYSTANAIRRMDVGNAMVGGAEGEVADATKFLLNLLPGMATSPIQGATNLSEAISGRGLDSETGGHKELTGLERLGRGASGAIDAAGVFFGGSGDLLKSVGNALFKKGASEAAKKAVKGTTREVIKGYLKAMLEEGAEEGIQQAFEFFGDGGKLATTDGDFDVEAFKQLLAESGQAAALGAVGGGIFHGGGQLIDAARVKVAKDGSFVKQNTDGTASQLSDSEFANFLSNEMQNEPNGTKAGVKSPLNGLGQTLAGLNRSHPALAGANGIRGHNAPADMQSISLLRSDMAHKNPDGTIGLDGEPLKRDDNESLGKYRKRLINETLNVGNNIKTPDNKKVDINHRSAKKIVSRGGPDVLAKKSELIGDSFDYLKYGKKVGSEPDTNNRHAFADTWDKYITENVKFEDGSVRDITNKIALNDEGLRNLYYTRYSEDKNRGTPEASSGQMSLGLAEPLHAPNIPQDSHDVNSNFPHDNTTVVNLQYTKDGAAALKSNPDDTNSAMSDAKFAPSVTNEGPTMSENSAPSEKVTYAQYQKKMGDRYVPNGKLPESTFNKVAQVLTGKNAWALEYISSADVYNRLPDGSRKLKNTNEYLEIAKEHKAEWEKLKRAQEQDRKEFLKRQQEERESIRYWAKETGLSEKNIEHLLRAERYRDNQSIFDFVNNHEAVAHGAGGYKNDLSMSNRAGIAMSNNIFPAEEAGKRLGVSAEQIERVLSPSEWHHVGKSAEPTNFYDISRHIEALENMDSWKTSHEYDNEIREIKDMLGQALDQSESDPNSPPSVTPESQIEAQSIAEIAKRYEPEAQSIYLKATAQQETLNNILGEISDILGVKYEPATQKSLESMVNKVARKVAGGEDYDLMQMKDHTRGKIESDNFTEIPKVLAELHRRGIEYDTELVENDWGYKGYHITFRNPDGISSEVQITTPEHWEAKKLSDAIYDKWRNFDYDNASYEEQLAFKKAKHESQALWEAVDLSDLDNTAHSLSETGRASWSVEPNTLNEGLTQDPPSNINTPMPGDANNTLPSSDTQTSSRGTLDKSGVINDSPSLSIIPQKSGNSNQMTEPSASNNPQSLKIDDRITTSRSYELESEGLPDNFDVDHYVSDQVDAQKKRSKVPLRERVADTTAELKHYLVDDAVAYERYIKDKNERLNLREGVDRVRSSDMIASQWMKEHGLGEIGKMSTKDLNEFQQYLIAKRAQEVEAQGKKTGRSHAADQALIDSVGTKYSSQEKVIRNYTRDMLEYSAKNGLISKKLKDKLLKENPNYVPMNRVFDVLEKKTNFKSKQLGNLGKQSVVQKMTGSERAIENPIESLMSNTMRMINEAERNKVAKLISQSEAFHEKALKEGENPRPGYDKLSYMVDGKAVSYEVPDLVAKEMKNLNNVLPKSAEVLLSAAGTPTRWLRSGATQNNPIFAVSNLVRDQMQTLVTGNLTANLKGTPDALIATFSPGKRGQELRAELNRVGIIGNEYRQTYGYKSGGLMKQLQADNNLGKGALERLKHPIDALGDLIGRTEYFTRAQQYFGTNGDATVKAQAARNNTLNFSRAGATVRILNRVIPFLNAGVQGGRSTVNSFKDRPVHTTLALASLTGVALAAKSAAEAQDKELWDRIDDSDKGQNIIIMTPEAHYDSNSNRVEGIVKVPVAQMLYPLMDAVNNLKGDTGDIATLASDILTAVTGLESPNEENGFLPLINQLTPTIVKPFLEAGMNKSTYTGNDLVSETDSNLAPEDKGAKYTTGMARAISKATGIDAPIIDNFIQNWGGGLAKDLSKVMTDNPDNAKDGGGLGAMFENGFNRRFLSSTVESQYDIAEGLAENYKNEVKNSETFKNLDSSSQQMILNAIDSDMKGIASMATKVEQNRADGSRALSKRQTEIVANGFDPESYITSITDKNATYTGNGTGGAGQTLNGDILDYGNEEATRNNAIKSNDSISSESRSIIDRYNSMTKDEWNEYLYGSSADSAAAEYKLALAKYENDVANGDVTDAQKIKREKTLAKLAVSKDWEKKYRDAYSLAGTKADMQAYLNTLDDNTRAEMVATLNGLNNAMLETGIITQSTYKTRYNAINNTVSSSSSSKKSSSGSKKSSGSSKASDGISAGEASAISNLAKSMINNAVYSKVKTPNAPTRRTGSSSKSSRIQTSLKTYQTKLARNATVNKGIKKA